MRPSHMNNTSLIPTATLAKELGVTRRTIARWRGRNNFPHPICVNGRLYYHRGAIEAWKLACAVEVMKENGWLPGNIRVSKSGVFPSDPLSQPDLSGAKP
jgi:predicted DNA-binding transcriptional regulator AlpA